MTQNVYGFIKTLTLIQFQVRNSSHMVSCLNRGQSYKLKVIRAQSVMTNSNSANISSYGSQLVVENIPATIFYNYDLVNTSLYYNCIVLMNQIPIKP